EVRLARERQHRAQNQEEYAQDDRKRYEENREQKIEWAKQYYINHREQIMQKNKQKYNCECGGHYVHAGKSKHELEVIHIRYLLSKSLPITEEQKAIVDIAPIQNCPCGGRTTHANKSTLFKSPRHQR